jgi:hypothetical protein
MAAIANGGLFAEESLVVPRHDVRYCDFNRDDTPGTRVFLDGTSLGDVLDNPFLAALRLRAATARGTDHVNRRGLVTFGSIAATHQYHPFSSLWFHAPQGVSYRSEM